MDRYQSNQVSGDELNAMQLLLNQVKVLQDQVTQLTSNPTQSINSGSVGRQVLEVPVQPMPNAGIGMDLKAMMSARLQGINGVPAYGASNMMEGVLQGMNGASNMMEGSSCIWVNGIPEELRNTKTICNIFGNFGNVMKVKFSRKKPEGALIEMQNPTYAAKCCKYLHDVKLAGGRISVRPSKIPQVVIHPNENDDQGRDFSRGFDHRYREANTKFTQIIMSRLSDPTAVLCISSVPEGKMSELKDYLVESGYTIKNFQEGKSRQNEGEPSKKKQGFAFAEFASTEEAINAVGKLHNTMPSSIGERKYRGLVFSFTSKRDL